MNAEGTAATVVAGVVGAGVAARQAAVVAAAVQIIILAQGVVIVGAVVGIIAPTRVGGGDDADARTVVVS